MIWRFCFELFYDVLNNTFCLVFDFETPSHKGLLKRFFLKVNTCGNFPPHRWGHILGFCWPGPYHPSHGPLAFWVRGPSLRKKKNRWWIGLAGSGGWWIGFDPVGVGLVGT